MFAIPVAGELFGDSKTAMWALVIGAGVCMTASAYFGIDSLTVISYIAVPLVAVLGTVAMVMAIRQGNGTIVDQFAVSSGSLTFVCGACLVVGSFVSGGTATPNFTRFAKDAKTGTIATVVAFFIGNSLMFFFGAISYIFVGGNDIFEVIKDARTNPIQQIETMASELHKTEHISPLDACKCTGNCGAM